MKKFFNKIIKSFYIKIKNYRVWYHFVIEKHNSYKLPLYHKLRAIKYGFSSEFYHMYNLEKNDPKDYISDYTRILSRDINEKYKSILDNKLIFEKVFGQYLTIPKNIIIILEKIYDKNGNIIEEASLNNILRAEKYIIKPVANTGGGMGVSLIKKTNSNSYIFNNKEFNSKELHKELLKYNNYVITEFIEQHKYSKKINQNSVNTIRIITIKDPKTGDLVIPCAVHRFGSKKSGIVDNASSGGYVTNIDVKKGILLDTVIYEDNTKLYAEHPDTGIKIKGTKIPHWDKITNSLLNVVKEFPYIPFIAWDVVVTETGFSVIEGNVSSSLDLFQVFGSIKDTKLGEFYKHHGYMK